jgi:hypothetical protein
LAVRALLWRQDGSGEVDFTELRRHLLHKPGAAAGGACEGGACEGGACSSSLHATRANEASWPVRRGCSASTWSKGTGRDQTIEMISGVEPAERRSLGPATYDPRQGSAFVRPSVSLGGESVQRKTKREHHTGLLPMNASGPLCGEFVYRGLPDESKPMTPASKPATPGGTCRRSRTGSSSPSAGHATTALITSPEPAPTDDGACGGAAAADPMAAATDASATLSPSARVAPNHGHRPRQQMARNSCTQVLRSKQGTFLKPA